MVVLRLQRIIIMGNKFFKSSRLSPYQKVVKQYMEIKETYHKIIQSAKINKNGFEIVMGITPSENSRTYTVKILYYKNGLPQVILLSPVLQQYNGKYPHHLYKRYENGHARLCVFHPGKDYWDNDMSIAKTFIPWVSTWLNTYEYWLITGEWHYDETIDDSETSKEGM